MDLNAAHLGFVYASYALAGVVLLGIVFSTLRQGATLKRKLRALDLPDAGEPDRSDSQDKPS